MAISRYERLVTGFVITVSMYLVMFSMSFFVTEKTVVNPLFLHGAANPPCVDDVNKLPISVVVATLSNGDIYRGTAFMIESNKWMTAAHVVEGELDNISISLGDSLLNGKIAFIGTKDEDIAIIETESVTNYTPMHVANHDPDYFEHVWNIGYPRWAGTRQVVTGGHVIGDIGDNMVLTSALVMGGMSGGPTVHCEGDSLHVNGVIKSYRTELTSRNTVIIDGVHTIENSYINSGEGYSTGVRKELYYQPMSFVK